METTRLRIKREYAPLTVYSSIVVPTNGFSTLLQTYNVRHSEYIPNRAVTPLTILPKVIAYAPDGSLSSPLANANLDEEKLNWYVDGQPIADVWAVGTDYEILTVGSDRGALVVYKNIPVTQQHRLHFEGILLDRRLPSADTEETGYACQVHEVKTREVTLRTIELADFEYKVELSCDPVVHYNPFVDPLLLYDYKRSHDIEQTMTEEEAKASRLAYEFNIPIVVFKGENQTTSEDDYTIKMFRIGDDNALTEISVDGENELIEFDREHIKLDLRLITLENYCVILYVRGEEKDRTQFAVRRLDPKFTQISHNNQTGIPATAKGRYDNLTMEHNGKILDCPGLSLKIVWFTDTAYKTAVQHNEGDETLFSLEKTGIGKNYNDDWLEIYTQIDYKPAYSVATLDDEDIAVDESGNVLIIN